MGLVGGELISVEISIPFHVLKRKKLELNIVLRIFQGINARTQKHYDKILKNTYSFCPVG